ncbi:MAG: hypothetical protein Q4F05_08305 [bacterium]|nr:hypothetical protein [bacterium]
MFEKKVTDEQKRQMVKEAKKENKKAKKVKGEDSKALSILKTLVIPAVFAAIVVCVLFVAIEKNTAQEELKTTVVCMKEDVKANTYVKAEDIDKYFTTASVEMTAVPVTAIKSIGELSKDGFYIESTMSKAQMVLADDLAVKNEAMDKYRNGYEITSLKAESFVGGVNGSLRKGDIVDVYAVDPATEMLVLMADNVYIEEVYDNSGNKIVEDSEIGTAFTVYVTESEVEKINRAICYGGVQMYLKTE